MQEPKLFEVRCPYSRLSKRDGKLYPCNSLCVKVTAGSAGETKCRKCRLKFIFDIDSRARLTTGVRVKRIDEQNENG